MGNEFGHPEWIDFPRPGNGQSYRYARRQWSLADNGLLRYQFLARFDKAMLELASSLNLRRCAPAKLLLIDEAGKTLVFGVNGTHLFVFNWHVKNSLPDYKIPVETPGRYRLALCSDSARFGGFSRVDESGFFFSQPVGSSHQISIYNVNRTALVFALAEDKSR